MMTEEVLPDWVKVEKKRIQEQDREHREYQERLAKDGRILQANGLDFWKRFSQALHFNLDACGHLKLDARMWPVGTQDPSRPGFSIEIRPQSATHCFAKLNIFYRTGSSFIECFPEGEEPYHINLKVNHRGDIIGVSERHGGDYEPDKLAESLVRIMASPFIS